jgi:D-alanine-D-alanine ligase
MKTHLRILLLVDDACIPGKAENYMAQASRATTEYHVITALKKLGHEVELLGVSDSVPEVVGRIEKSAPDLVFNLTETFDQDRLLDCNIAALLELMNVPFSGTGSAGLMLCRNKALCKLVLKSHGIRVPAFFTAGHGGTAPLPDSLRFPVVVKPLYEDGSEGIANASMARNLKELTARVRLVRRRWKQPVIAEEYVAGRELYVSVVGNRTPVALPPWELRLPSPDKNGPSLATYRVKWNSRYRRKWRITLGPAVLPPPVLREISETGIHAYRLLQMKDYGRIDMRLTPENEVVVLEANPNPDIGKSEEVACSAARAGITYTMLIDRIVRFALHRGRRP